MNDPGTTRRAIVVFSGGQDSTTCLYWALHRGWTVYPVTFDYNQRHRIEINASKKIVDLAINRFGLDRVRMHEVIELGPVLKGSSPLVSGQDLEQYKDNKSLPGGLEKTFVPMRNQLFLTVAANRAAVHGCDYLVTGVCEEDYGGYPDCRSGFIHSLEHTCNMGTFTGEDGAPSPLTIRTPLMSLTKAESVNLALTLPGCYEALAYSHTSYDGRYPPKGHDHATLLREKGFEQAMVPDPLVLRAYNEGLMPLPSWTLNLGSPTLASFFKLANLGEYHAVNTVPEPT